MENGASGIRVGICGREKKLNAFGNMWEDTMTRLYKWYFQKEEDVIGVIPLLHGVVTGHRKLPDATKIHTSYVLSVEKGEECIIVETMNTKYICGMKDCDYQKNREFLKYYDRMSVIPEGLEKFRDWLQIFAEKYENLEPVYSVSEGGVLLRLGNNRKCYFDSIWHNDGSGECRKGKGECRKRKGGYFPNAVLCEVGEYNLNYWPYRDRNLEFYRWEVQKCPAYIENCGDRELRMLLEGEVYVIQPEQRLLITPSNATPGAHLSSIRDLYLYDE